jgi:Flp pilus assembly protein TadG
MKRFFLPLGRRLRNADGQSLIEAAIITPVMLLLTIGIFEFGALFYAYMALQNGVSQATRFAITGNTVAGGSRIDSVKSAMRTTTPTLTIPDSAFAFSHLPSGGTAFVGGVGGPGEVEKVTITYTWKFFTPLMRPFFPSGQMTMRADSTMKNEPKFQ